MRPCSVCESRGSFHLVLFESDEQGGDQFASQEMTYHAEWQIPGSPEVVDLKNLLSCPNQLVCFRAQTPIASRYYYEFKQKFFDIELQCQKIERSIFVHFQTTFVRKRFRTFVAALEGGVIYNCMRVRFLYATKLRSFSKKYEKTKLSARQSLRLQ